MSFSAHKVSFLWNVGMAVLGLTKSPSRQGSLFWLLFVFCCWEKNRIFIHDTSL